MFRSKEQKRLKKYEKDMKKIIKIGDKLNIKQKGRLAFYANRFLAYCTNRTLICSKNERLKDTELIPDEEQAIVYKEIFDRLNNIAIRISEDDILSFETKKELRTSLKSLIGHVRGKQNINNKYAKKYQILGYIRAKTNRDFCEQRYLIQKYVKEHELSLDAIYVDDATSEEYRSGVNTALKGLNQDIINFKKHTIVVIKDITRISRDIKIIKETLEIWKQNNTKLVIIQ